MIQTNFNCKPHNGVSSLSLFDFLILCCYLRFAQLLGSGNAKRLCASAIVAPIVSSVNVRSTDILRSKKKKRGKKKLFKNYLNFYLVHM